MISRVSLELCSSTILLARSDMPMHELYAPGEATSLVCSLRRQHLKLSMTLVALKTMSSPALQMQHSNETSAAKMQAWLKIGQ